MYLLCFITYYAILYTVLLIMIQWLCKSIIIMYAPTYLTKQQSTVILGTFCPVVQIYQMLKMIELFSIWMHSLHLTDSVFPLYLISAEQSVWSSFIYLFLYHTSLVVMPLFLTCVCLVLLGVECTVLLFGSAQNFSVSSSSLLFLGRRRLIGSIPERALNCHGGMLCIICIAVDQHKTLNLSNRAS